MIRLFALLTAGAITASASILGAAPAAAVEYTYISGNGFEGNPLSEWTNYSTGAAKAEVYINRGFARNGLNVGSVSSFNGGTAHLERLWTAQRPAERDSCQALVYAKAGGDLPPTVDISIYDRNFTLVARQSAQVDGVGWDQIQTPWFRSDGQRPYYVRLSTTNSGPDNAQAFVDDVLFRCQRPWT